MVAIVTLLLAAGVFTGLVVLKWIETGKWQVPELADFERIIHPGAKKAAR